MGLTKLDYNAYFDHNSNVATRSGKISDLKMRKFNHEYRRHFFTNAIVKLYNLLGSERNTTKFGAFKNCVIKMVRKEFPNVYAHTRVRHVPF